jgi:hypothetical protein
MPASGDSEDDCGDADGMHIGGGNGSSRRKPAPAPLLSITKSHMTIPGFEPGPSQWEAGTNRLNYGTALSAKLVPTFAGRGCYVFSGFLDRTTQRTAGWNMQ